MYSERFDPAPPPSRENSVCHPYGKPSNLRERERERVREREKKK